MKPTGEQIQWLWEQCGLKCYSGYLYYKGKQITDVGNQADLNLLFKYAVPIAKAKLSDLQKKQPKT